MEKRIVLERRARSANQITDLNLDNCRSTSIVGLSDEYTALESLSLINVGLTTLKGFPKLPNLKKLELSDNRISNGLNYLHTSPKLYYLNLSGNKIKDLEALKPLEVFKHLAVLDLFNNEATQIENYREKTFEMLPSLTYLDGFDCNDVEAQSEIDEEDDNGNYSEYDLDEQNAFNLNGLEIDLDELEEFEKRLKAKREAAAASQHQDQSQSQEKQNQENTTTSTETSAAVEEEIDELDEYLKTLKLKEQEQHQQSAALLQQSTNCCSPFTATTTIDSNNRNLSFALLLYWFLAILNMASATFYSEASSETHTFDNEEESCDEEDDDVSLSEVYNEDLEEDDGEEGDWNDENAENDDDDDLGNDASNDNQANDSAVAENAVKEECNAADDAGAQDDETQARGKKRKHEG